MMMVQREGLLDILVVDHASTLGGAELCLLDIVKGFSAGSRAFLFQDGPLRTALMQRGIGTTISNYAINFTMIKKDQNLLRAMPYVGRLAAVTAEIAYAARRHRLVYATSQKAFALAAPAALLARRPLVWHLHDILSPAHFSAAQRRLAVTLANRLTTLVIVPSQAAAIAFVEAGGDRNRVQVVANGLDMPEELLTPMQLRATLGLPKGFLFGVFSRLSPWKGQHVAIEALAQLPNSHCLIVGAAMFGEDTYAASLRETAARLGVTDRVIFLGHRHDVGRFMRAVDVMVHPSVKPEPFGRTLVEAMLCRVPIIAARNGATPEILDDGRAGFLVPPGNALALANVLCGIMRHEINTEQIVTLAELRARASYNESRMVGEIVNSIRPVLANLEKKDC